MANPDEAGRECSHCSCHKPWDDFHKQKGGKNGRRAICKECNKKKVRDYREKNKDTVNKRQAEYREANKERLLETHRKYREENREACRERTRKWRENNREYEKERSRRYNREHADKRKAYREKNKRRLQKQRKERYEKNPEYLKNWRNENPEKMAEYRARRTAVIRQAKTDGANMETVGKIYLLADELNKRDDTQWQVDHTVPISKGGLHHEDNLQVVPAKWNLEKNNTSTDRWHGNYPDWVAQFCEDIGL